jgi:hypothetical protein
VIDDLIHRALGIELTARAAVARLATRIASPRDISLDFAPASARPYCRVLGGLDDGGLELVRESWRACSSSRLSRSSGRST